MDDCTHFMKCVFVSGRTVTNTYKYMKYFYIYRQMIQTIDFDPDKLLYK